VIINELSKSLAFFISIIFHLRNLSQLHKGWKKLSPRNFLQKAFRR